MSDIKYIYFCHCKDPKDSKIIVDKYPIIFRNRKYIYFPIEDNYYTGTSPLNCIEMCWVYDTLENYISDCAAKNNDLFNTSIYLLEDPKLYDSEKYTDLMKNYSRAFYKKCYDIYSKKVIEDQKMLDYYKSMLN